MIVLHANPVAGDNADDTHDLAEMAALDTVEVLFVGRQAAIGIVEIDHVAQRVQVIQRNAGRDLHRDEREKQTEVALGRGWPDRFAPPPRAGDAPFAESRPRPEATGSLRRLLPSSRVSQLLMSSASDCGKSLEPIQEVAIHRE